jgi:hypothetical protein
VSSLGISSGGSSPQETGPLWIGRETSKICCNNGIAMLWKLLMKCVLCTFSKKKVIKKGHG